MNMSLRSPLKSIFAFGLLRALEHRIQSIPHRFVTLAPILLVFLAGTLSMASMYRQLVFTSKEIQGTYDIEFLIKLRSALKEARGLRQFPPNLPSAGVTVNPLINLDIPASDKQTVRNLSDLNRSYLAEALSSPQWLSIKRRYGFHLGDIKVDLVRNFDGADFDYAADFNRFSDRLEDLNEYFALVADESNLTLDPQLDTYYLMSLTTAILPSLIDVISEIRGAHVSVDLNRSKADKNQSSDLMPNLSSLAILLEYQLTVLNRTLNIISFSAPSAYASLKLNRLELVDKIDSLNPILTDHQTSGAESAIKHWNLSTDLVGFLQNIETNGLRILREKLEDRRRSIALQLATVSSLLLLGSILIYLVNQSLYGRLSRALINLNQLANTDPLTKLLSRRSLSPLFYNFFRPDSTSFEGIGVCLLDIDHFKLYNDTYGHAKGDDALVAVASLLKENLLRKGDSAFRYGGEEFLLLVSTNSSSNLEKFLESLRARIEKLQIPHSASHVSQYITVSIGAVFVPSDCHDINLENILLLADKQLYDVKNASRNGLSLIQYTPDLGVELTVPVDRRMIH